MKPLTEGSTNPLPEQCPQCGGTYCCPECNPQRPGLWTCDGCRGWREDGGLPGCFECEYTGWVLCEQCEGADDGCDVCMRTEPPAPYREGEADPLCDLCGDTALCQHCRPVRCSPDGLRLARERAAWSWAEAGHALGVAPGLLRAMEVGHRPVTLRPDQARRLAGWARMSVDALGYYDPETYPRVPDAPLWWTQADEERRALYALARLGAPIKAGDTWSEAITARIEALAGVVGGEAGAVLRKVAGILGPADELLELRGGDDVEIAVALTVLAARWGDERASARFDRLAYRLRALEDLQTAADLADDVADVHRHLARLFEDDPGTTAALDRLTREVMHVCY